MTAAYGHLSKFQPQRENVFDYLEHISLYFEVNGVAEGTQVAVLLTAIEGETMAYRPVFCLQKSHVTRVMKK